jgi:CelD/BcsL family acetyltransferase involved in cellulose biosynthesis
LLNAALRDRKQPIVFPRHPCNDVSIDVLANRVGEAAKVRRQTQTRSPSVPIAADPDQMLSAGRRSDLRRMMRRAEKHGKVRFDILAPAPEETPFLLDATVRLEAAGWKGRNRSALKHHVAARRFFERYAVLAARSGILRMAFMYIDDRPVAAQIAVQCSDVIWLLKIGYDETYADCSPGNLLMLEMVRHASRTGLKRCEFLGVAESWTRMWTKDEYATESIALFPNLPSYFHRLAALMVRKAVSRLRHNPHAVTRDALCSSRFRRA